MITMEIRRPWVGFLSHPSFGEMCIRVHVIGMMCLGFLGILDRVPMRYAEYGWFYTYENSQIVTGGGTTNSDAAVVANSRHALAQAEGSVCVDSSRNSLS